MSEPLPVHVDPLVLADRDRSLSGTLPVAAFRRLGTWLAATDGDLEFVLEFGRDTGGRRELRGQVAGSVALECQRCGSEYRLALDHGFALILVGSDAEADTLPEELDAVVVGEGRSTHTVDLLEDELILALPLIPRCEAVATCEPAVALLESEEVLTADEMPRQQPFSGLDDRIGKKPKKQ